MILEILRQAQDDSVFWGGASRLLLLRLLLLRLLLRVRYFAFARRIGARNFAVSLAMTL